MAYPTNWPQNVTDIANRVMSKIGEIERFTDIDTDTSDNAVIVRDALYDTIRDTQSSFQWPELETLSTIATPDATFDNSGGEYPYAYRFSLPDDYLRPINEELYNYKISGDYIYADVTEDLDFHYIAYSETVTDWSAALYRAVLYRTAIEVCLQITQSPDLKQSLLMEFEQIVRPECFRVSSQGMAHPNTRRRQRGVYANTRHYGRYLG